MADSWKCIPSCLNQVPPQSNPASVKHLANVGDSLGVWYKPFSKAFTSIANPQECKLIVDRPLFLRILKQPSQVFSSLTAPVSIRFLKAFLSGSTINLLQYIRFGMIPISSSVGTSQSVIHLLDADGSPNFAKHCLLDTIDLNKIRKEFTTTTNNCTPSH